MFQNGVGIVWILIGEILLERVQYFKWFIIIKVQSRHKCDSKLQSVITVWIRAREFLNNVPLCTFRKSHVILSSKALIPLVSTDKYDLWRFLKYTLSKWVQSQKKKAIGYKNRMAQCGWIVLANCSVIWNFLYLVFIIKMSQKCPFKRIFRLFGL